MVTTYSEEKELEGKKRGRGRVIFFHSNDDTRFSWLQKANKVAKPYLKKKEENKRKKERKSNTNRITSNVALDFSITVSVQDSNLAHRKIVPRPNIIALLATTRFGEIIWIPLFQISIIFYSRFGINRLFARTRFTFLIDLLSINKSSRFNIIQISNG